MIQLHFFNAMTVLLSLIFQILIVRFFGASFHSDSYYLAINVFQFVYVFVIGLITDFYIPIYNEMKLQGTEQSKKFTWSILVSLFLLGSFTGILLYFGSTFLIKLFASGFSPEKIEITASHLRILSTIIVFIFLNAAINATLQADLILSLGFATMMIGPATNIAALLLFGKTYGMDAVFYAMAFSYALTFFINLFYFIRKIGISPSWKVDWSAIPRLLKQNAPYRAAMLIYSLKSPITTNILSHCPTGYITLFGYADRVLNILFNVTNSPTMQVLYVKSSNYLAYGHDKIDELKRALLHAVRSNNVLFVSAVLPFIIFFKPFFRIMFGGKIAENEIEMMYRLFLALIPFYLVYSFELPFLNVVLAMKRALKVLSVSSIFIFLYIVFLIFGRNQLHIYVLPAALFLAQIHNTGSYVKYVHDKLSLDFEYFKIATLKISCYVTAVLMLNFLLHTHFYLMLMINILFIVLWGYVMRKELISVAGNLIKNTKAV